MVRRLTLDQEIQGSNPCSPAKPTTSRAQPALTTRCCGFDLTRTPRRGGSIVATSPDYSLISSAPPVRTRLAAGRRRPARWDAPCHGQRRGAADGQSTRRPDRLSVQLVRRPSPAAWDVALGAWSRQNRLHAWAHVLWGRRDGAHCAPRHPHTLDIRVGGGPDDLGTVVRFAHGQLLLRPLPPHQKYGPQLPVLSKWPSMS